MNSKEQKTATGVKSKSKYIILISLVCIISFSMSLISDERLFNELNIFLVSYRQQTPWYLDNIKRSDQSRTSIKIAVMDSGVIYNHPDLKNLNPGYNAIDPTQLPIDDYGHGTYISGIMCAQDNDVGIVGIVPEVELYPVKVLNNKGEGKIEDVVEGINWCIDNDIQIINMSFSMYYDNPLLYNSIKKATSKGIVIVASAENSFGNAAGYPASYPEVISVNAIDKNYHISDFSPQGKIDFSAPGVNLISTSCNGEYENRTGTSVAAPYISSMIARIMENPNQYGFNEKDIHQYSTIHKILQLRSLDLGPSGWDDTFGYGFPIL